MLWNRSLQGTTNSSSGEDGRVDRAFLAYRHPHTVLCSRLCLFHGLVNECKCDSEKAQFPLRSCTVSHGQPPCQMKVNGNPKQVQASSAGETTPRFPLTSTNEDSYQTRIQATTLPRLSNPPSRSTRPCFGKHCTTFGASASTASLALDYCATRVRNTTTTPPTTPESHPRIPSHRKPPPATASSTRY